MSIQTISIVGAGNVATHLALGLLKAGITIRQIVSRNITNAQQLAVITNSQAINDLTQLNPNVDAIIIAVNDGSIPAVVDELTNTKAIVLHTAGSIPATVLQKFTGYGVLYPFQTISKNKNIDLKEVPFFIEANSIETLETINQLALKLSNTVTIVDSTQRLQIHLAAVFACNFVNHLYTIANKLLTDNNISFDVLLPLIKETTEKIEQLPPYQAQTGPAARGDNSVIDKHLKLLHNHPQIAAIYKLMSESIIQHHQN